MTEQGMDVVRNLISGWALGTPRGPWGDKAGAWSLCTTITEDAVLLALSVNAPERTRDYRVQIRTAELYAAWVEADMGKRAKALHNRLNTELSELFKEAGVRLPPRDDLRPSGNGG